MKYGNLRNKAALVFLQHLLEKSKTEKFVDMKTLFCTAWGYAADFLNERPSKCLYCPYDILADQEAWPKVRKNDNPAKPKQRK